MSDKKESDYGSFIIFVIIIVIGTLGYRGYLKISNPEKLQETSDKRNASNQGESASLSLDSFIGSKQTPLSEVDKCLILAIAFSEQVEPMGDVIHIDENPISYKHRYEDIYIKTSCILFGRTGASLFYDINGEYRKDSKVVLVTYDRDEDKLFFNRRDADSSEVKTLNLKNTLKSLTEMKKKSKYNDITPL